MSSSSPQVVAYVLTCVWGIARATLCFKYNAKLRTYAARKRILLERRGEAPFALQREDGTKAVTYEERAETLAEYNRKLLGRNVHPGEENEEFEKRKDQYLKMMSLYYITLAKYDEDEIEKV